MTRIASLLLVLVLVACGGGRSSPEAPVAGEHAGAEAAAAVDASAPRATSIRLPRDEAPHAAPIEWWYYTGLLRTAANRSYGFELVVFQAAMPKGLRAYLGHLAITDRASGTFHLATKSAVASPESRDEGFDLDVDGWRMKGHAGSDEIAAALDGYGFDLKLAAQKPVVLQYGDGEMTIGSERPFYYYSYTRMAASGSMVVGDTREPVEGSAWMDHQWGEMGGGFDGWDWFSLRLDDRTEVMIFRVRRSDAPSFLGGTFVEADGTYRELVSDETVFTPTGTWTSPHTGGTYPHGWTVKVSSLALEVEVVPVLADQEFYESEFHTPVYWEGLCDVRGKRGSSELTGHAYVELVGYAR